MQCVMCRKEFTPSKYRPKQKVCLDSKCQKLRQLENEKNWRLSNPEYFKCLGQNETWRENRHRYSKLWKQTHKEHLKDYNEDTKEQRRIYMREYMRVRRKK